MNKIISTLSMIGIAVGAVVALEGCRVEFRHDHGHWHRPGHGHHRPGHDHGRHRDRGRHRWLVSDAVNNEALELAAEYDVSIASATKILDLAGGENQKERLKAMGLEVSDVSSLANLELPSRESIDKLAAALGEDSKKIQLIMSDFIEDIKAEEADDVAGE